MVIFEIPLAIGIQLAGPPGGVGLGGCAVVGAAVPEAAVDEYRDAGTGEDDVSFAAQASDGPPVFVEPHAVAVEGGSEGHLRLGVPWSVRLHRPPHGGTARPGLHVRIVPDTWCGVADGGANSRTIDCHAVLAWMM